MSLTLQEQLNAFNADLPLEQAHTIPSAWYFHPEIYALECRNIFGKVWHVAARADQVAAPGTFATTEVAGEPILVVRGDDGVLRAFANVCRHRAAQVINEAEGPATKLRCRYHGWTYDLCGHLRGAPEFEGVQNFCRENFGLPEFGVAVWGPLVFVNLAAPAERPPLADFLQPLPERTAALHLEQLHFVERREYDMACNWKVFVDNYQDGGYHVNTVHPGLAGALDYKHYHTEIAGNTSVQISPLKPADDAVVTAVHTGDNAYYWWIFPNLMINLYQGVMDTNLVLPLGPDHCKVIFDFYFANVLGPEARRYIEQSIAVGHQVQLEDMGICDEVQRGLKSRTYNTGRFSVRREAGGYHFHRLLARQLRG